MAKRSSLTTKFFPYVLAKKEKEIGMSFLDFLNVGKLEINKILLLIQLGNSSSPAKGKFMEEEDAANRLMAYLDYEDDNGAKPHSIISAFIDLIGDLDIDMGFLRETGMTVESIRDGLKASTAVKTLNVMNETADNTVMFSDGSAQLSMDD